MQEDHTQAIVTGATAVFVRDLYRCMYVLQSITGNDDVPEVARVCANYLLAAPRCKALEKLVTDVLEHPHGLPVAENQALLAEVMHFYHDAREAERAGTKSTYHQSQLVPEIMQSENIIIPQGTEAQLFISTVQNAPDIVPSTPFEHIVCAAINNLYK